VRGSKRGIWQRKGEAWLPTRRAEFAYERTRICTKVETIATPSRRIGGTAQ